MYRVLMSIFAVWAAFLIPSVMHPPLAALSSGEPPQAPNILLAAGLVLIPISVAGLWRMRLWGFASLVLGFILVLAGYPSQFHLHAICVGLTIFRYFSVRQEVNVEGSRT